MAFVKRFGQEYFLCRKTMSGRKGKTKKGEYRNWFLVKISNTNGAVISMSGGIVLPDEFKGKRVRFRLEVIEEENEDE